ncbi:MAG: phosphatase PAP2 family protein [Alphaproteobacteria bacterium]
MQPRTSVAAQVTQAWRDWTRERPRAAALGVTLAVCAGLMVTLDRPVALAVHAYLPDGADAVFQTITDLGDALPYVLTGLACYLSGRALFLAAVPAPVARAYWTMSRMGLYLLITMAVSGAIVHILKFTIGRLRPKHLIRDGQYGFDPGFSEYANNAFPSGHSQAVFSVMMVLTLLFPRLWFVFLPFGAVVAASRIFVSAHFPSDVIMGSFIGIACAILVRDRWFADLGTDIGPRPLPAVSSRLRMERAAQ